MLSKEETDVEVEGVEDIDLESILADLQHTVCSSTYSSSLAEPLSHPTLHHWSVMPITFYPSASFMQFCAASSSTTCSTERRDTQATGKRKSPSRSYTNPMTSAMEIVERYRLRGNAIPRLLGSNLGDAIRNQVRQ